MDIKIVKLTDKDSKYFKTICTWQASWWGKDYSQSKVLEFMEHCLNNDQLPQTYVALSNNEVVGMYQITMYDNIDVRPDYYPWLINVYVSEEYRGQGICDMMMKDAVNRFKDLGIKRIYLHTKHENLYEKYGWIFLENVEIFTGKIKRIYYLDIK